MRIAKKKLRKYFFHEDAKNNLHVVAQGEIFLQAEVQRTQRKNFCFSHKAQRLSLNFFWPQRR